MRACSGVIGMLPAFHEGSTTWRMAHRIDTVCLPQSEIERRLPTARIASPGWQLRQTPACTRCILLEPGERRPLAPGVRCAVAATAHDCPVLSTVPRRVYLVIRFGYAVDRLCCAFAGPSGR